MMQHKQQCKNQKLNSENTILCSKIILTALWYEKTILQALDLTMEYDLQNSQNLMVSTEPIFHTGLNTKTGRLDRI